MAVLVKNPERVRAVVEHTVQHYQTKVEPNGSIASGGDAGAAATMRRDGAAKSSVWILTGAGGSGKGGLTIACRVHHKLKFQPGTPIP